MRLWTCLSAVALLASGSACDGGGDEAERAPAAPARDELPSPAAPAPGLPDPEEPGISDLARVARYVFRAMQQHDTSCSASNPFLDPLRITLAVRVQDGRIVEATLAGLALQRGGDVRPLEGAEWPAAWSRTSGPFR